MGNIIMDVFKSPGSLLYNWVSTASKELHPAIRQYLLSTFSPGLKAAWRKDDWSYTALEG